MSRKKKILIGILTFVIVVVAVGFWASNRNRTVSPPGKAELTAGDLTIPYSRPSVHGRTIFGTQEEEALQPYGIYWRLGANEFSTTRFVVPIARL